MSAQVLTVTADEFDGLLKDNDAVLIDFWAEWCGPCKMMSPVLDSIAGQFSERLVVGKVNVDNERQLASQFSVMSIPTLILFKGGQPGDRFVGYMSADDLATKLETALG